QAHDQIGLSPFLLAENAQELARWNIPEVNSIAVPLPNSQGGAVGAPGGRVNAAGVLQSAEDLTTTTTVVIAVQVVNQRPVALPADMLPIRGGHPAANGRQGRRGVALPVAFDLEQALQTDAAPLLLDRGGVVNNDVHFFAEPMQDHEALSIARKLQSAKLT